MSHKVYLHCIGCQKTYIYTVQDVPKNISTLYRMSQKVYLHCIGCPKKYIYTVNDVPKSISTLYTGCPKKYIYTVQDVPKKFLNEYCRFYHGLIFHIFGHFQNLHYRSMGTN